MSLSAQAPHPPGPCPRLRGRALRVVGWTIAWGVVLAAPGWAQPDPDQMGPDVEPTESATPENPETAPAPTIVPITLPDGAILEAEVAATPNARTQGLMFREHLEAEAAMLFVFERDDFEKFWMKNTWVDLDILYLGPDRRIRHIFAAVPRTTKTTPDESIPRVRARAQYVLELSAGASGLHQLKVGDQLTFEWPPAQPESATSDDALPPVGASSPPAP